MGAEGFVTRTDKDATNYTERLSDFSDYFLISRDFFNTDF